MGRQHYLIQENSFPLAFIWAFFFFGWGKGGGKKTKTMTILENIKKKKRLRGTVQDPDEKDKKISRTPNMDKVQKE